MSWGRRRFLSQLGLPLAPPELSGLVEVYALNFFKCQLAAGRRPEALLSAMDPENPLVFELFGAARKPRRIEPFDGPMPSILRGVRAAVLRRCAEPPEPPPAVAGAVGANLAVFSDCLGLEAAERAVLQFMVVLSSSKALADVVGSHPSYRFEDTVLQLAQLLQLEPHVIRTVLSPERMLLRSGLLVVDRELPGDLPMRLDPRVVALALEPGLEPATVLDRFLRREPAAQLALEDYGPRKEELEAVTRVLAGWRRHRGAGVNVLFYGASGVGKTEAARVIARAAGLDLYLAGASVRHHESPSCRQRLASLGVGQALLRQSNAVLLFDEVEDVTGPRALFGGTFEEAAPSKLWMNRLLETNPVPTLWTSNSIDAIEPALLRRFAIAVEFPPLSDRQRRGAWARLAGTSLSAAELDALSSAHDVSPGEIDLALKAARLAGVPAPPEPPPFLPSGVEGREVPEVPGRPVPLDREVLRVSLEGAAKVRGARRKPALRAAAEYRLEAVNASRDLALLADKLSAWRPGPRAGLTLCLYGRSGTGKSEFVHHLARRMDRPLLVRRVSDLKSKWVGDTERHIAAAFEQAHQEGAVLLFDEADTFLADRRAMQHEHERAFANEFLQQLEASRGFVAVTTNLYKDLDPAVLRRFLFKVEFFPVRPEQRLVLWDAHLGRFLGQPLDEAGRASLDRALRAMGELVPSDFSLVARRLEVLEAKADPELLLRELEDEVAARRHDAARPIGFREPVTGWGGPQQLARAQRTVNQ